MSGSPKIENAIANNEGSPAALSAAKTWMDSLRRENYFYSSPVFMSNKKTITIPNVINWFTLRNDSEIGKFYDSNIIKIDFDSWIDIGMKEN